MQLNRRNTLIGLGALAVGGGALFSTGAFTTVEAQRDVNVEVAGDASAFLGLHDEDTEGTAYSDASTITDGTLELIFDSDFGTGDGTGLNLDATTTFDPLFRVINNGEESVDVRIFSNDASNGVVDSPDNFDSGAVIQNIVEDNSSNSLTIEYQFRDQDGNSIVEDESTGSTSLTELSTGDDEEITLAIGVGQPPEGFVPSEVDDDYIDSITIVAET